MLLCFYRIFFKVDICFHLLKVPVESESMIKCFYHTCAALYTRICPSNDKKLFCGYFSDILILSEFIFSWKMMNICWWLILHSRALLNFRSMRAKAWEENTSIHWGGLQCFCGRASMYKDTALLLYSLIWLKLDYIFWFPLWCLLAAQPQLSTI